METVVVDSKRLPIAHTEDELSLISDSGITRYRLSAKIWDVYVDSASESYSYFPEGIYVEKFDTLFNIEGNLSADTAYYFDKQKLWKAIGNVKVVNLAGEKFETSELYLDDKAGKIYTDKFIRIERRGQLHTGYGFRSNQSMSDWEILNHSGEIDIPEENLDSTRTDSIGNKSNKPIREENEKLIKR